MKKMIVAACIIILSVFSVAASGVSEREAPVKRENIPSEFTPAPIDIASPVEIETATFGLG